MSGKPDRLIQLWREKRGEAEGEDLSNILAVQMGSFTEPFNVAWFEKQTGIAVHARGELATNEGYGPPMRATLDGKTAEPRAVFEAKHCGTRSTDAEIFARYVPQLTHNCLCAGEKIAFLSVFKGNGDWVMFEYDLNDAYVESLLAAEMDFWRCVETGEPPVPIPEAPRPKAKGVIEYDMSASNEWGSYAADYIETVLAADRHETAKKALKALVPDDASMAFGHNITIKRSANGALRFGKGE